jgi:hypothetical protein
MIEEADEILDYLPIDDLEVNDYINPLFKSALVTFEKEEYQFSYFALHLIFMTNIYSYIWKIGRFHKERYEDSLLFARPYNGCEVDFKDIKSVFEFSHLPEKDIFEFFALIGVDNSYIKSIKGLIDTRNQMAHATGKFQISSVESFNGAIRELVSVLSNLQSKLNSTIREWYKSELTQYAKNSLPSDYSTITDYINDVFLNDLGFSKKDLSACNEFGLNKLKNRQLSNLTVDEVAKIVEFHEALKKRYSEIMEIEYSTIDSEAT